MHTAQHGVVNSFRATSAFSAHECFSKTGSPHDRAEPVAFGYRCQHECPVGTNGDICGDRNICVRKGKCMRLYR